MSMDIISFMFVLFVFPIWRSTPVSVHLSYIRDVKLSSVHQHTITPCNASVYLSYTSDVKSLQQQSICDTLRDRVRYSQIAYYFL